jgi:hypothetical protein
MDTVRGCGEKEDGQDGNEERIFGCDEVIENPENKGGR